MDGQETTKYQKSYFDVLGLCCSSEVPLVENILKSLDGVKEYSVIVPTKTVIVLHDHLLLSQLQIVKALNQARLEANIRVKGDASYQKKWPSPYAMGSGVLLIISLFKFIYHPLQWVALGAVAIAILPILLKAIASLRNLRLDMNLLILIAVGGTIAMFDFVEAGFIVFLFSIAEWLESRAGHRANATMSSLMSITPQKAVIAETGEEVDADEVKLNTILAVKAGETIPIDGIVVDGTCEVDEKTLTGESYPVLKHQDSPVWAGTINLNGYISVKTTALAEDCVVAKMAKLVEEAQGSKSKAQRFIDKCAQYYTPIIIGISAILAIVPLALRLKNRDHWMHLALVFLVSGCPCPLILSTPVATFCALTKAATNGVLIKGGDHLERLAKIKVMAFDKTGTITRGDFVVSDFQSLNQDIDLDTLLYCVSSIESKSSHPMADALVDHAKSLSVEPNPDNVVEFRNFPGEGIMGIIDGKEIYIGNRKIGTRAGCETVPLLEMEAKKGKSVGYVYSEGIVVGSFALSDACRTGAKEGILELKSLGIQTVMLTGDTQAAAMHAQRELENALDVVHAQLLPEDKARIIQELKKEGITAMIGDGVNDAPALATADIGISMGISGSALATETGHVILMSNDIRKVPKTIKLAGKAHRKVIENVILSISTKAAVLALAFAGHPLVWAAVLADVGTSVLVTLNSMLLLRDKSKHKHKHERNCCKSSSTKMNLKKCLDSAEKPGGGKHCGDHGCNSTVCTKKPEKAGHCHKKHSEKKHIDVNTEDDSSKKSSNHQHDQNLQLDECCNSHNNRPTCNDVDEGMSCRKKSTSHVCRSFEKREIGGCCRSYRKECCKNHGQFGAVFSGGLQEIITE